MIPDSGSEISISDTDDSSTDIEGIPDGDDGGRRETEVGREYEGRRGDGGGRANEVGREDEGRRENGGGRDGEGYTSELKDVKIRDFNEHTGPTILNLEFTELDYFTQIFPQEAIDLIVSSTNHYADQSQLIKTDPYWSVTSPAEIKAYIGLNILFGIVALPTLDHYWSTNKYLGKRNIEIFIYFNEIIQIVVYNYIVRNCFVYYLLYFFILVNFIVCRSRPC